MLVILKGSPYTFEGLEGKKVIAKPSLHGGCQVTIAELYRVCSNDPYSRDSVGLPIHAELTLHFPKEFFELVQPTMKNCSDSNVGKGWDGFYNQHPIKRSKFR